MGLWDGFTGWVYRMALDKMFLDTQEKREESANAKLKDWLWDRERHVTIRLLCWSPFIP